MQLELFQWFLDFISLFATFLYCYPAQMSTSHSGGEREVKEPWEPSRLIWTPARLSSSVDATDARSEADHNVKDIRRKRVPESTVHSTKELVPTNRDGYQYFLDYEPDAYSGEGPFKDAQCDSHPIASPAANAGHSRRGCLEALADKLLSEQPEDSNEPCSPRIHDMIAGRPIICSELPPKSLVPFCESPVSASEEDNDLLRVLSRDRRNLVLDSLYPHIAPHIVITPPEYCWDDYFIPSNNAVDHQWPFYLIVPPQAYSLTYSAALPPTARETSNAIQQPILNVSQARSSSDLLTFTIRREPRTVFRHSAFSYSVELASTERLIFCRVISALQKHRYKAAAIAASEIALSFRRRYDNPDFVHHLERPFQWIDPAQSLLAASRYLRGTTIIDSVSPFTVPHIMINEGPPDSPWVALSNAINDPQDCNYGNYLTVPCHSVTVINSLYHDDDDDDDYGSATMDYYMDFFPASSSRPDTPVPQTPELANGGYPFVEQPESDGGNDEKDSFDPGSPIAKCRDEISQLVSCSRTFSAELTRSQCEVIPEDDDEEDLPPFDDWYQNIAERAQTVLVAA